MMRFCVILIGLAASAAYSHETPDFDLPIPEVKRVFYAADAQAAFRWGDIEALLEKEIAYLDHPSGIDYHTPENGAYTRFWHVAEVSESQHRLLKDRLASIQMGEGRTGGGCEPHLGGRFGLFLVGDSYGGVDGEYIRTLYSWRGWRWGDPLKTRFSVLISEYYSDTDLRDTGMSMRFSFTLIDNGACADAHTSHSNGDARHTPSGHFNSSIKGPWTDWIPIADLLDGNVATSTPAEPEEPEAPAEPAEPADNNAEVERLQAELDALRGDLSELNGDLSAVRDSVAFLLGEPSAGGVDTVEVVRHDTLLFCPQTDEERRDLFDLFTGLDDDESETDGPAGKAASVQLSSWGAVKALVQED